MGLFGKLFQSGKFEIGSPVKGTIVPISNVSDPTFGEEMVGKGIAIEPSDGRFCAPCDGTLIALFPTGHAFCINTTDGAELLVHIGIDTVKLKGEHYKLIAKQGIEVKKGDPIVEVDLDAVRAAGYQVITPMVISNHSKFSRIEKMTGVVEVGDTAIVVSK